MQSLPTELLYLVLRSCAELCRSDKNELLNLRLVCRAFDRVLRPMALQTLQLEFSRFSRLSRRPPPSAAALPRCSTDCRAVFCDMMVIRDDDEIARLREVFGGIAARLPEMGVLIDRLQNYCMDGATFDEQDFKQLLTRVLRAAPLLERFKLILPFQVIGHATNSATLLLATMFLCLARRPEEFPPLQTLVLEHVSDSTILAISNNPYDLANAITTMKHLKHLVLTMRRQEPETVGTLFSHRFWFLIGECIELETLCIHGWNTKRNYLLSRLVNTRHRDWNMRSLPEPTIHSKLSMLRCLELKRIDAEADEFVNMIRQLTTSLRELYLFEVYLKYRAGAVEDQALWIGNAPDVVRPENACWVAEEFRNMPLLQLEVLRVTGLGYDIYFADEDDIPPTFDLIDPFDTHNTRTFDERFVEAVYHVPAAKSPAMPRVQWDADTYHKICNPTSQWKRSLDGIFCNHNDKALRELQQILTVADRGMAHLAEEIDRLHSMARVPAP